MRVLLSYLFIAILPIIGLGKGIQIPDEQKLYEDIMVGYESSVRPVLNSTKVLVIKFALRLNQIVGLDERHQILTTNVFIDQTWIDENLIWNPEDYNNIRSIRIPTRQIWLPDTFIYNNADDGSTGFMQGSYVLIHHDGMVMWPIPFKLKSSCKVDITFFPFDDQICIMRFGSWIYSGNWIDFTIKQNNTPVDLSSYMNNSEWELLSISYLKNVRRHACCPETHPYLTFMLHIRRKTFYYIFNIIVPCSMLSILTMLTFWLPPTSGEKVTLGLSVFLAFSMFMLLIAEEVPATSEAVPLIGIYLCVVMTMTSVSVIVAVLVINVYNRGMKTERAPYWLRKLTLKWLSKGIFMHHDIAMVAKHVNMNLFTYTSMKRSDHTNISKSELDVGSQQKSTHTNQNNNSENYYKDESNSTTGEINQEPNQPEKVWYRPEELEELKMVELLEQRNHHHRNNSKKGYVSTDADMPRRAFAENEDTDKDNENLAYSIDSDLSEMLDINKKKIMIAEWQRMAAVMDRVLFILYLLATITAYLVLLIILPAQHYTTQKDSLSKAILQNNILQS